MKTNKENGNNANETKNSVKKVNNSNTKTILAKPKFRKLFKKSNKNAKEETVKNIKVVLNLTKCSDNWKKLPAELKSKPAPFKRQVASNPSKAIQTNKTTKQLTQTESTSGKPDKIWFDVDNIFLPEANENKNDESSKEIVQTLNDSTKIENEQTRAKLTITKVVALDCEMVGVGADGKDSILARVSLVNQFSDCIYDKYVIPTEKVTDYRTKVSGIRPDDLKKENGAVSFSTVQKEVANILKGRILVGHAVHNDLQVLYLSHEKKKIRDTQKCKIFRRLHPSLGGLSSLKNLAKLLLSQTIQEGEHNSIVDAQVTMRIYTMYKKEWEADLHNRRLKTNDDKLVRNVESEKIVKNGVLQSNKTDIEINSGNETHKKYLINKIKKRNTFIKKFKK